MGVEKKTEAGETDDVHGFGGGGFRGEVGLFKLHLERKGAMNGENKEDPSPVQPKKGEGGLMGNRCHTKLITIQKASK